MLSVACTQTYSADRCQQGSSAGLERNMLPLSHMVCTHRHIPSSSCSGCCFFRTMQTILSGHLPPPSLLFFFFFPFSVSYVFAFHFSVRKLWDGISTYLGLSHSVHATAASRPRLGMLSWLLFSALATLVSFVGALSFLSKCQSNQFMSPL